jgi:hypothetical protein
LASQADGPSGGVVATGVGSVSGYLSEDHRVVTLVASSRGGTAEWHWDLDDPCRAPVPLARRTHTVVEGEWLWRIARGVFAAEGADPTPGALQRYVAALHSVNHEVIGPDPDLLRPGMVLVIPPTTSRFA